MSNLKLGRWLLVALAVVGLAFAAPVVSAHDDAATADDAPTDNATANEWATLMGAQMTEHAGAGSVDHVESHVGATVDEMTQYAAGGGHSDRMHGQSHC